jgi:hypothetical protein
MRLGCTSYCCANSASVFSPPTAASATLALNAGLWFRRGRLLILPPLRGQHGRCQIGNPLIPAVQIPRTTSVEHDRNHNYRRSPYHCGNDTKDNHGISRGGYLVAVPCLDAIRHHSESQTATHRDGEPYCQHRNDHHFLSFAAV